MKKIIGALLAVTLLQAAWGQIVTFNATLTGSQETPPVATPATGWATATLNLNTLWFDFDAAFGGLLGSETAAHIHVAPPGVAGPVVLPLPLGSPISLDTTITAAQANDLLNGLWYVNIHSTVAPGGEIRGQLMPVPEPSTYAAVASILLGAVMFLRYRARRGR
jgi:hypothetical protein